MVLTTALNPSESRWIVYLLSRQLCVDPAPDQLSRVYYVYVAGDSYIYNAYDML